MGPAIITEIVTFVIPDGMTREEVVAGFRRSAPGWRGNPDLIRENDLFDAEVGLLLDFLRALMDPMAFTLGSMVPRALPGHGK